MKEPKIRFKGFQGEWETHALSEYFKKVCDKNTKMECTIVLTNSAEHGIIPQNDFFDHAIANNKNIGGYYIVSPDDFVYNPRVSVTAPVGPINRSLLDFQGVMSPLYLVFKINTINKDYLNIFYKTNKWHTFMKLEGNCGARFDRLSISDDQFVKMPLTHPKDHSEQQSIASYFQHLDSLIQSTTKKIESLKQVKAASLQSMFPQEGETTPRVRFKGFEGEWEECLLKDKVNNITTGKLDANAMVPNGKYRFYTCGKEYFKIDKYAFDDEALLISGNGENVGYIHYYNGKFNAYQRTYVLTSFTLNVFYLEHYLKARLSIRINKEKSVANTPYIKMDTISDMNVLYPNDIAEQRAIASYFTTLDHQINLQTQRLEKLKQIKAACLDNMFV